MRHGYAGKRVPDPMKDLERTLTVEGKKEVKNIAKSLKKLEIKFDIILSSPLPRALQTAMIIQAEYKLKNKVELCDELIPKQANKLLLYNKLTSHKAFFSILIVGHEPYLSNMISDVISKDSGKTNNNLNTSNRIVLKKSGLSKI
ncbi:MAG: phosphohistidine phosphatase SixA, partial [Nitrososphaeraceae archaeon]